VPVRTCRAMSMPCDVHAVVGVGGPYGAGQAVVAVVGDAQGVGLVLERDDREDRYPLSPRVPLRRRLAHSPGAHGAAWIRSFRAEMIT
jgi:hypothetical protein